MVIFVNPPSVYHRALYNPSFTSINYYYKTKTDLGIIITVNIHIVHIYIYISLITTSLHKHLEHQYIIKQYRTTMIKA